ncbi:MAG: hypothetical protein WC725_03990 [Patescibacteria group bacterium]|jgi:hypothetical protein
MLSVASTRREDKTIAIYERAKAGMVAILSGSPGIANYASICATTHLMINCSGDWLKVLDNSIFKLLEYEERVAVLPLALGEGILQGCADNRRMKKLCDELDPDQFNSPACRVFTYLSALLVGSIVIRPYYTSERGETDGWLRHALKVNMPDCSPEIYRSELAKFEPFFRNPDTFLVPGEDPDETVVMNTLVAVQTARLRPEWEQQKAFRERVRTAEIFTAICQRGGRAN